MYRIRSNGALYVWKWAWKIRFPPLNRPRIYEGYFYSTNKLTKLFGKSRLFAYNVRYRDVVVPRWWFYNFTDLKNKTEITNADWFPVNNKFFFFQIIFLRTKIWKFKKKLFKFSFVLKTSMSLMLTCILEPIFLFQKVAISSIFILTFLTHHPSFISI